MSTTKKDSPRFASSVDPVRARQIPQSANCAYEVQTFVPLSTHPSSVATARVLTEARSEPASGSLNS